MSCILWFTGSASCTHIELDVEGLGPDVVAEGAGPVAVATAQLAPVQSAQCL